MRFLKNPNFQFMAIRKTGFMISGVLLLISLVSLILHGGPRFGIDFRGGSLIQLRFEDRTDPQKPLNIPIDNVRSVFAQYGLGSSEIKHYGSRQDISIQMDAQFQADSSGTEKLKSALEEKFSEYNILERGRDTVGPKIGSELVGSAIMAILFSLLLILVYIMFRFEFRFGVGAVVALFHDVFITLGIFSIFNIEISVAVVAALLTIIGYSLNDTIVVYDRIRENLKTLKRKASNYTKTVNQSINDTLSRTLVTSGTTFLVVLVLFIFGGAIIQDFAFALICGVIIGTYSSIFIASPVLVEWENRKAIVGKRK